jgi:hypothetical protein
MGTDIHAFVEYADDRGRRSFTARPDEPACFFGRFLLQRDYALFDALGDGRNSQMAPEDVGPRSLYPPRGIPADLSLQTASEYYDLVVEGQAPHASFWPAHRCVSKEEAEERIRQGAHSGEIVQCMQFGTTHPRTWRAVSRTCWHTPSWLLVHEIEESLNHHRLSLSELRWDFRVLLRCLTWIEEHIGRGQGRLVFWFDN